MPSSDQQYKRELRDHICRSKVTLPRRCLSHNRATLYSMEKKKKKHITHHKTHVIEICTYLFSFPCIRILSPPGLTLCIYSSDDSVAWNGASYFPMIFSLIFKLFLYTYICLYSFSFPSTKIFKASRTDLVHISQ